MAKKTQQTAQYPKPLHPFFYVLVGACLTLLVQVVFSPGKMTGLQGGALRGQLLSYEICGDGVDNNADGKVDCDDSGCAESALCYEKIKLEVCGDGLDNDEDGRTDCSDSDCATNAICLLPESCADGVDNDLDGYIDCQDNECYGNPLCPLPEVCGDGIDNDLDGYIDCADAECALSPVCPAKEVCDDGVDNDENGVADCDDEACALHVSCTGAPTPQVQVIREVVERTVERILEVQKEPTIINNVQQGGNTFIGGGGGGPPKERHCTDGVDNDGNGKIDCEDLNCASHPSCFVVTKKPLSHAEQDLCDQGSDDGNCE